MMATQPDAKLEGPVEAEAWKLKAMLANCVRFLPQHLDSGGFFCALIERLEDPEQATAARAPALDRVEKQPRREVKDEGAQAGQSTYSPLYPEPHPALLDDLCCFYGAWCRFLTAPDP